MCPYNYKTVLNPNVVIKKQLDFYMSIETYNFCSKTYKHTVNELYIYKIYRFTALSIPDWKRK